MACRLRLTVTVPCEWVSFLDEYKKRYGYTDLAELVRSLLRDFVEKELVEQPA